jgi:glycine/D-amino acid oxidase-like deaminating enzyme/nitrite reductase/ring-hydroxylating ferredoxin subunit
MASEAPQSNGSTWYENRVEFPDLGTLREDIHADVCVVGAGVAGLSIAYLLAQEGKKVVVLESDDCGSGETGRTTAHLASALDDRFTNLENYHGEEGAKLAADSHARAIDRIEAIVKKEHINCDFERLDGYLFTAPGQSWNLLDEELEAAKRAGLEVERVERAPLPNYDTGPALRFANQAQFHPIKYLAGLANAILRHDGRIYVNSPVNTFEGGEKAKAGTRAGPAVHTKALVVATNTPVNDRVTIHTKQVAYRTYAMTLRIPAGLVPAALYWDTADPYHYVRLQKKSNKQDLLIVGGEDHKTGRGDEERDCFAHLEAWTRERFPKAGEVESRWSGQVLEPVDYLAFIGRNPGDEDNVYIATGDSGHGMTHGTIAGILITDLILGRDNPWASLYDPARKSLRATGGILKEAVKTAGQYLEWVTGGDVSKAAEIEPGEGAVVRKGLTKLAVYRDEKGRRHTLSAVCPHLGCIVEWNSAEKTWDCPCHGSRFSTSGEVLNGPALKGLEPVGEEAEVK